MWGLRRGGVVQGRQPGELGGSSGVRVPGALGVAQVAVAVGHDARPVADVASELGCDGHTANRAVLAWGEALLAADCDWVGAVEALGLDETLFWRSGPWRTRSWCTSIVDVTQGQMLDLVPGRDAADPTRWLLSQPRRGARASTGAC